jgi:hypothetical protein
VERYPGRSIHRPRNDRARPREITSFLAFVNDHAARLLDPVQRAEIGEAVLADPARVRPSTRGALEVVKVWSLRSQTRELANSRCRESGERAAFEVADRI